MRVLAFLSKPLASRPLRRWLGEDVELLLVASPAAVAGVPAEVLDRDFVEVAVVSDYESHEGEVRAVELHRRIGYDRIVSAVEFDVLRAARLRELLGLPGQDVANALPYRDKAVMKRHAAAAGVPTPRFRSLDDPLDLVDFVRDNGYPVVVKPALLGGSMGVRFLRDEADLVAFLASGAEGPWLVEEFADGDLHHVDGMMLDGKVLHCWPSAYLRANADTMHSGVPVASWMLDRTDPVAARLRAFVEDVVAALPPTTEPRSFHLEAFVTRHDVALCEIACRAGGAGVVPAYARAFGIDLIEDNLRGQAGLPVRRTAPEEPRPHLGWIWFPTRSGRLARVARPCPAEGALDLTLDLRPGEEYRRPAHVADAVGHTLVTGPDSATVRRRVRDLDDWWAHDVEWEAVG